MARLVHVTDEEPGIRRQGRSRVRYVDEATGEPVRDPEVIDRIRRLAVPPAWRDVWICADPGGHIQATGRDARGRKQYRYHADHRRNREAAKFDELVPFGRRLGTLRSQVDDDLSRRGLPLARVVALIVALLDRTYVRVGNEEYARDNGTFGLTTMRGRHASIVGGTISLRFKAKGGKQHEVACTDPRLARIAQRCKDIPGQLLFCYVDGDTAGRVTSSDVNDYLRASTGLDATAKTFRTWHASALAAGLLAGAGRDEAANGDDSEERRREDERGVIDEVAAQLGNTAAVCRRSYIHPTLLDRYQAGDLAPAWWSGPRRPAGGLDAAERRLLHVLSH